MQIAGAQINNFDFPVLIAEISGNHNGSILKAKRLIREAKKAGADFVKTQCYDADTLTLDCRKVDFIIQSGLWRGQTLHELYTKACTPPEWHKELYEVAQGEGIAIFSSVFDRRGLDLLESLGCPAYKIASFEVGDTPLIRQVAATGKPLIISTGLATDEEIKAAKDAAGPKGKVAFLHCTSEYPGNIENSSLNRIAELQLQLDGYCIGISDHTPGHLVPIAATVLGVAIIEKHLKLENSPSEDDSFSLTPAQFSTMRTAIAQAWEALKPRKVVAGGIQFKRSLYAVADIAEGDNFTHDNIRSIRPGYGAPPRMLPRLLGTKASKNYRLGDPI